ncbi:calmodulin-like protein containing EF hand domain [Diplonema papillatum]|nr:calmodulin-like protein containing EF hand domain [Diplonema papillatum]
MAFTVLTAADVHATKLNFELDFAAQPPLAEFEGRVTAVFAHEASLRRPPGVPNTPSRSTGCKASMTGPSSGTP